MKSYVVYKQRIAGHLMTKGFVLHDMGRNTKFPNRNVFYFTYSEELIKAIEEYQTQNI